MHNGLNYFVSINIKIMYVKTIISIVTLMLLISCKGQTNKNNVTEKGILYINLENATRQKGVVTLSSTISDVQYVPLETNDASLIKKVERAILWDDYILISDYFNLFMFDKSGKYIRKISQQGGGPTDYLHISHIITNPSTDILYLFTRNKFMAFDKGGNYINSYPLEAGTIDGLILSANYNQGVFTPDNTLLMYNSNSVRTYKDTAKVNSLIEMDTEGNIVRYYENRTPRYLESRSGTITMTIRPLFVHNNLVYFNEYGNDTIYTVRNGIYTPYAILDLGKMKMDHNPDADDSIQTYEQMMARLLGDTTKWWIKNVVENNDYMFIQLSQGGLEYDYLYCTYDKKTRELTLLEDNGLRNDIDGGIAFYPNQKERTNEMIMWKSAEEFKEEILSKDYNTQKTKYGERFEMVYQLANSLKDDDNPVLVVVK